MNRPYIFCHMMTSLDGKIMGGYMDTPQGVLAGDVFYELAFGENAYYKHQGWLSGRVTTDDNFTFYKKPNLPETAIDVPEGDYVADDTAGMYYVSIDPHGRLGWEDKTLQYEDTKAHVIEVLCESVSKEYRAFLRNLGISYIIAGKDELDLALVCTKLKELFSIEKLMLGGGGVLNWSFIQAGLCDEISVVITSAADGSTTTPTLFETREGLSNEKPVGFTLTHAQVMEKNCVWLRYLVEQQ